MDTECCFCFAAIPVTETHDCPAGYCESAKTLGLSETETKIISGFPGVGKSFCHNSVKKVSTLDSDSSKFDKADFPRNYIEHIKSKMGTVDVIFVSSHKDVREALVENGLIFTLTYPEIGLKKEYLERYRARNSPDAFVQLVSSNWEVWITELMNQQNCVHQVLKSGEYYTFKPRLPRHRQGGGVTAIAIATLAGFMIGCASFPGESQAQIVPRGTFVKTLLV